MFLPEGQVLLSLPTCRACKEDERRLRRVTSVLGVKPVVESELSCVSLL